MRVEREKGSDELVGGDSHDLNKVGTLKENLLLKSKVIDDLNAKLESLGKEKKRIEEELKKTNMKTKEEKDCLKSKIVELEKEVREKSGSRGK